MNPDAVQANTLIFDALGQSISREDLKGDFGRARQIAEQWLSRARAAANRTTLADALVWRGIVHIMQGEPLAAVTSLEEAEQLAPGDGNVCLRAATYKLLVTYERFNLLPDGNGAGSTEISARWRGAEDLREPDEQWHALLKQATDPQAQNEAWLVYAFLCNLKPARSVLEGSRYTPSEVPRRQLLENFLTMPLQVRQAAQANGILVLSAYADWCAADLSHRAGEIAQARQFLDGARVAYQQANDDAGVALCLMTSADWECAPFSTPVAWNFALQESSSESSNLSVSLEADEFSAAAHAELSGARASYAEAERLFRRAAAKRGVGAIHLRRGYLAMLADDYAEAASSAEQARAEFEASGDGLSSRLAETHLIMSRIGAGQFTDCIDLARAIGEWGSEQGSFSFTLSLGTLLNRFGRHHLIRRGDYERAFACYRAARALFEPLLAVSNLAQSLVDQGLVHQAVGERSAALTLFEEALDLYAKDMEARPQIASNLRQRSMMLTSSVFQLYLQRSDADGMEHSAARLKAQLEQLPFGGSGPSLLSQMSGAVAAMMSEDEGASRAELPEGVEYWSLAQLAQSNIGLSSVLAPLYRSRQARDAGDDARATELLAQAEAALPQVNEAQRTFLRTTVLAEQKRFDEAAAAYRQHLTQGGANAGFAGMLSDLMSSVGGEHGQAEARLQQRRTHEQAFAVFVRVKAYSDAKQHLDALEQLAGKRWCADDSKPWQPLSDCAEMYEGLGDSKAALDCYDQAISELEARRGRLSRDELKTALSSDKGAQYLYFQASRAAMRNKYYERAFDYAERGKARGLLDLMAGSAALARASESESVAMRAWREINARLTLRRGLLAQARQQSEPSAQRIEEITLQLADDEIELRSVESGLARANPDFHNVVSAQAGTLSIERIAEALPSDALLIEYYFLGDDVLVWAIDREGLAQAQGVSLEGRELVLDIGALHRACEKRESIEPWASRLAEKLLAPLAANIRAHSRLIMVPHGPAHLLPFQALPFDGEPLIEKHRISYLPSASTLQFMPGDWSIEPAGGSLKQGQRRILAVGNPTGNLPEAGTEAAFVAGLFGERPLLGDDATEQTVRGRIADCRLLHFATHGNLSEDAPLSSSIALAHGEELTVYELMGLRLNASLVVLSACNTGQGETTGGDDVLGLTRGLLGAGARSAIVSLWPVNDASTSLLMGEFYRRLRSGEPPDLALQSAQGLLRRLDPDQIAAELGKLRARLETASAKGAALEPISNESSERHGRPAGAATASVDDFRHPYHWAPFVLVGC